MKKVILLPLAVTMLATSCANHSTVVYLSQKPSDVGLDVIITQPEGFRQNESKTAIHNHYFLFGFLQKNSVDGKQVCGATGVKKIVVEQRWYQKVFELATFGIYSPMQTTFYCN